MAVIQVLLDSQRGPLPLKGQFQPQGDLVPSIFLSGTAQASAPGTSVQVQMAIYDQDGKSAGFTTAAVTSNEAKQHKTLLALLINQEPFTFGSTYSYVIQPVQSSTISDANDFFSVTILY
jgi:hypothetical protein